MTEIELQELLGYLLKHHNESDGFVEFKTNIWNKTGEYISALSNEACLKKCEFGFLVFGISDNKEIVGTEVDFKSLKHPGNQPFEMY